MTRWIVHHLVERGSSHTSLTVTGTVTNEEVEHLIDGSSESEREDFEIR